MHLKMSKDDSPLCGNITVQELVARVKRTQDATLLVQIVREAHDLGIPLFHYAAAVGDRDFFSLMAAFLPPSTFAYELQLKNPNGMTPSECAKGMNPALATSLDTLLLSNRLAPDLKRVEVSPSRFVVCSNAASTVGATLRANGVYYAAARAVYVRQVRADTLCELETHGQNLLAFPADDSTLSLLWRGSKIAELAKEGEFRASFQIYAPCKSSRQLLAPGMTVLLDLEHLSPSPSAEENLIIIRCLPSAGTLDTNTPTHHNVCISDSGVRVADKGYRDDTFLKGFRRGWYGDMYYRTVGDRPNRYLSGGDAADSHKLKIRDQHDFGFASKRLMIKLPDEGYVYCRGVGDDKKNPELACVLFDSNGQVRDRYGHLGKLGRWNDIFQ